MRPSRRRLVLRRFAGWRCREGQGGRSEQRKRAGTRATRAVDHFMEHALSGPSSCFFVTRQEQAVSRHFHPAGTIPDFAPRVEHDPWLIIETG
jgi:hypothetical protein